MTRLIFHSLKGWGVTDIIVNGDREVSDWLQDKVNNILQRLYKNEPIQYILGEAYFYGMNLLVNRSVLIPRPETAEMVDMIINKYDKTDDLSVLDIGTGSGAIAIALSRFLPFSKVTAIDNSPSALEVARDNAKNLKAKVDFKEQDIFVYNPAPDSFDIIVSNPPYIKESEKSGMASNVLDYEPHTALFVSDGEPLIYYSRIATVAGEALKPGGELWLEINPEHADDMQRMLAAEGFEDVRIIVDIHRRKRFAAAVKPAD